MNRMQFVDVVIPEQYVELIQAALMQVYQRLTWDLREVYGIVELPVLSYDDLLKTPMAATLAQIARAAAGQVEHSEANDVELVECVQSAMELFFSSPLMSSYSIPEAFWGTPVGAMIARARLWVRGDALITLAECAKRHGISLPAVSAAATDGRLTVFYDPDARSAYQGARLVSREESDALWGEPVS